MGLGVAGGQILAFPIDNDRRPYNTLALPCECVMSLQHMEYADVRGGWSALTNRPRPRPRPLYVLLTPLL